MLAEGNKGHEKDHTGGYSSAGGVMDCDRERENSRRENGFHSDQAIRGHINNKAKSEGFFLQNSFREEI